MTGRVTVKIRLKMKWWLQYLYLPGLSFAKWFAICFMNVEIEPNVDKVARVVKRGLTLIIPKEA